MTFRKANKNVQMLNMKIVNINIKQVNEFNFLGLIIKTDFNWKRHIKKCQTHVLQKLELKKT